MADYIVKDTELTSVANAIRTAGGTSSLLTFPNGFANAINNISGGGGGSSDFSMINVTVVGTLQGAMPFVFNEGELGEGAPAMLLASHQTWESGTYKLALYKGETVISILNVSSISGNITHFDEDIYVITGDCTITIS